MIPVGLRCGVAKPLVRYFMGKETPDCSFAVDRIFVVKNVTGVLHTSVAGGGLKVGQFFIGIRGDIFAKELKRFCSDGIILKSIGTIFGIYPRLQPHVI